MSGGAGISVVALEKRRITFPRGIWQTLGLQEDDRFRVTVEGDPLMLTPVSSTESPDWQRWRGRLAGTQALQEHTTEHADEVAGERLP